MTDPAALTRRRVVAFWLPLAATWLMMAVEGPFLAALVARLAEPKGNLAAFGVTLAFALILESPVIMLMGAATALVTDLPSLARMRRFTYALSGAVTALMAVLVAPPVFRWVAGGLMDLPPAVVELTYPAVVALLPWPAAIGYRRLYQGVLIRSGRTRLVGLGTGLRLVAMGGTALLAAGLKTPGALTAALGLSAGVVAEAAATRWMVRASLARLPAAGGPPLGYRAIGAFYAPLAASSVLTLAVHPLLTFFLAQGRLPLESLAVFPVVRSLVFLFSCLGLSYQEVGIALLGPRGENTQPVRQVAVWLGLGASAALGVIAFSPTSALWFGEVSGLSPALVHLATFPTQLLTLVPGLTVASSYLRSRFVHARVTAPVTWATVVEVAAVGTVLSLGIHGLDAMGATAAAAALLAGRFASVAWLAAARPSPATDAH